MHALAVGKRIYIRRPTPADQERFIEAVKASTELHHPWVHPPTKPSRYTAYLDRIARDTHEGFFVCLRADHSLAGVVNLNEIVRGLFQSAYMGYEAFVPHNGRGLMTEGLALVISYAFAKLDLHRLEANIQPDNVASIALVRKLGFRREGYSQKYLKIDGEWRDHERWALLRESWRAPSHEG